jgi:hypothetical protein
MESAPRPPLIPGPCFFASEGLSLRGTEGRAPRRKGWVRVSRPQSRKLNGGNSPPCFPTPPATHWRRKNYRSFKALNDTGPKIMAITQL